jgi:uncharacterized protein (DUF2141 family)
MKSVLMGLAVALAWLVSAACETVAATSAEIRVEVATLRSMRGHVICALFDSEDSYKQLRATMRLVVEPKQPVTTCIFHDVVPGGYLISAIHDENDNGTLDKNLLGMPKEGYGVSNNHTYALKGPEFKESAVHLNDGPTSISIKLRYPGG